MQHAPNVNGCENSGLAQCHCAINPRSFCMKSVIAAAALAALLSGCASIVGSQTQT
jgi:hypothetical protein